MLIAASLAILLLSALAGIHLGGSVFAQSVEAVTIKADGTVEPTTASIIKVGDIYTLTENIQGSITIEKSNIIVNGAGHILKRDQQTRAISLHDVNNVVIMNFQVSAANHTTNSAGIFMAATNSTIANNTVTDNACGIWVYSGSGNVIAGNNVTRNYSCGIELDSNNNTVIGNYITSTTREPNNWMFGVGGINIDSALNNRITENQIANNSIGIHCQAFAYFAQSGERKGDNQIYRNNLVDNDQTVLNEALFSEVMANIWDDGTAGNHWSDYGGKDENGDGVGDTPYVIDDLNQDNFPLMAPVKIPVAPVELPGAPLVVLLNPVNITYSNVSVLLDFVVDKQTAWIGYSLDGKDNVTITGNITLSGLSDGSHMLTVYANDTFGFTGTSETVTFTVATFPTTSIILIVISTVAVVACLLIYFKKRKR